MIRPSPAPRPRPAPRPLALALAALALAALALAGCAPTGAALRRPVDAELARRLGDAELRVGGAADPAAAAAAIAARLERPLDRAAAVRIALANSERLRAALARIGVASAGLALGLGAAEAQVAVRFGGGNEIDVDVDVLQDLRNLITAAPRRAAGRLDVAAAQAAATAAALRLAARVEMAFDDLIAAQQELELRRTAFDAADAAATVRERMHAAGNTSTLALARDRDAREQARVDLARAEAGVEVRREAVNALLGLTGAQTRWTAEGQLPELPAAPPALDDLERRAVAASVELAAASARAGAAANRAADERLRAALPHLAAGLSIESTSGDVHVGPAVSVGLPLLDWNSGGRARARAEQARAEHELAAAAVELRAAARAARVTALATYQEARHLREIVLPLRQQIVDEIVRHYNAMDADPFELIAARRELVDGGRQYLDALRRYWNAMSQVTALERGVAAAPGEAPAEAGEAAAARMTEESHR